MTRLLAAIAAGDIDVLWYDVQDRFARDVAFTSDTIALLRDAGVEVWEGNAPVQLDDDGQTMVEMKAVLAAAERRKIRERTRKGIAARSRSGKHWGAVPFGYRKTDDGRLESDPEELAIVGRVFATYIETGGSYNGTAAALTRTGVRPPKGGGMWGASSVKSIIAREHPTLDPDTWQTAQTLAGQSKRWSPRGGGRLPARHVFVRGALKCGICMEAMLPRTERKRGKLYETYQCRTNKTMGSAECPMPILLRSAVEITALEMFAKTAFDYQATREHVAGQLSTRVAEVMAQAARVEREAADLQGQADRVERDYRRGALPAEDYARMRADIAGELTATAAERTRLIAHTDELRAAEVNLDAEDVTLRALAELGEAITGRISNAEGIGALRAAMAQVFEFVAMVPIAYLNDEELPESLNPGQVAVVPAVREEMVASTPRPWPEDVGPLRRVGLALGADTYQHGTLLWKYMTQNTFRLS